MTQIQIAARNPLPALIGALLGALVPSATFIVGHYELTTWTEPRALIVLGGLMFSALTVFKWGKLAFGSVVKAIGFVVLAEGVMTFCSTTALCVVALGYLVLINAIATGCTIAIGAAEDQPATEPSLAEDIGAQLTVGLTRLEARLTAVESPLFARRPAKRPRKRPVKKPVAQQLVIAPEVPALPGLPAEDLLGAAFA